MPEIRPLIALCEQAGQAIMEIYERPLGSVQTKADDSPLTEADLAAHHCLVAGLRELHPDIPVLSEEASEGLEESRLEWREYWLIDPLDGTKEFIRRNGEFTVNLALIREGCPVLGIVHAPVLNVTYCGDDSGAWRQEEGGPPSPIRVADNPAAGEAWRVVGSRSHQSEAFAEFMKALPAADIVSMGSSLKFCLVAEGRAHLYPRLGPTCEWDTAAAQAVVESAGGQVLEYPALVPLRYNTRPETLLNPWFIVCNRPDPAWSGISVATTA